MTLLDEFERSISELNADELQEMIEQARDDSKDSEIMCESSEDVRQIAEMQIHCDIMD